MKLPAHSRAVGAALIALAVTAPAAAQNAGQIASARNGASCPGCDLFQADLSRTVFRGKNFARVRLRQANLSAVTMSGVNLSSADLRDVNAYGGLFTGANLSGANLTNATFVGAHLVGARFAGANLSGVNFSGAEMGRVSGLTQAQLNRACGDESTQLPAGLRIPNC